MAQRLPTGAVVEEVALQESRLQFRWESYCSTVES